MTQYMPLGVKIRTQWLTDRMKSQQAGKVVECSTQGLFYYSDSDGKANMFRSMDSVNTQNESKHELSASPTSNVRLEDRKPNSISKSGANRNHMRLKIETTIDGKVKSPGACLKCTRLTISDPPAVNDSAPMTLDTAKLIKTKGDYCGEKTYKPNTNRSNKIKQARLSKSDNKVKKEMKKQKTVPAKRSFCRKNKNIVPKVKKIIGVQKQLSMSRPQKTVKRMSLLPIKIVNSAEPPKNNTSKTPPKYVVAGNSAKVSNRCKQVECKAESKPLNRQHKKIQADVDLEHPPCPVYTKDDIYSKIGVTRVEKTAASRTNSKRLSKSRKKKSTPLCRTRRDSQCDTFLNMPSTTSMPYSKHSVLDNNLCTGCENDKSWSHGKSRESLLLENFRAKMLDIKGKGDIKSSKVNVVSHKSKSKESIYQEQTLLKTDQQLGLIPHQQKAVAGTRVYGNRCKRKNKSKVSKRKDKTKQEQKSAKIEMTQNQK